MRLLFLAAICVACAPAVPSAQPTATAPPVALATQPTLPPSALRSTDTPALTPTVTRTPTLAATPLPTPANVTFKFDDGVPQSQRETIVAGLAMARAYLGDSRPLTIIAYADLNAQMDEISRFFEEPRTSPRIRNIQQLLQIDRANAYPTVIFFSMSKTWQARPQEDRMLTTVHEYFHTVEGYLTNTDPFNYSVAEWLYEGTADFAAYRVLGKYGYYNLDAVYEQRVQRTRGILSPLSAMEIQRVAEREMVNAPYYFGYIADEMLAAMAGEQAVLRTFWENYPKYPGWQLAFKATFGITVDEFYKRFEDARRAQFPPYCGTQGEYVTPGPSEPFTLKIIRQDPPGDLTSPVAYTFCATGYPIQSLFSDRSAIQYPPGYAGAAACGANCIIVYMPQKISAGTFTFAIELPDKRRAEAKFEHFVPSGTSTPKP